jgi:hypothetical protein
MEGQYLCWLLTGFSGLNTAKKLTFWCSYLEQAVING